MLKDVVENAEEHRTQLEVQLETAIVEHKHPHFCEGNDHDPVEREILVAKVLKTRENHTPENRSWKKLGSQIRGSLKPEPDGDGWQKVEDKEIVEEHLME
jgi:hypothetical protein